MDFRHHLHRRFIVAESDAEIEVKMIAKACLVKSRASYPMLEDEMKTHSKVTIRVGKMQVEGVMFFFFGF